MTYFLSINCIEGPCIRLLFTDSLQVVAVFCCVLGPGIATAFVHTESGMDFPVSADSGQF